MLGTFDWGEIGALAGVASVLLVIGMAVGHRWSTRRQTRRLDVTAIHTTLKDHTNQLKLLEPLPTLVTDMRNQLLGVDTPWGHLDGFVDEVRKGMGTLVGEATENGGHSMKDDSTAIRKAIAPHPEDGDAPQS